MMMMMGSHGMDMRGPSPMMPPPMISMMMARMTAQNSQRGMFQPQTSDSYSSDSYDYDYDNTDDQSTGSSPLAAIIQSLMAAHVPSPQPEPTHPHVEIAFTEPTVSANPVEISPETRSASKQEAGPKDQISYRSAP